MVEIEKMKRYIFLLFAVFNNFLFACPINDLIGVWIPQSKYELFVNNYSIFEKDSDAIPVIHHDYDGLSLLTQDDNYVFYMDNNKVKANFNCHEFKIENIKIDKRTVSFDLYDCLFQDDVFIESVLLFFLDEDTIEIKANNTFANISKLVRISTYPKISIKDAIINDNRVRLRVKPNLTCDTWALLDKGLPVKIKDKSKKKFEIDGEKWYWYKVDHPDYPDGWLYGKYLDIEK